MTRWPSGRWLAAVFTVFLAGCVLTPGDGRGVVGRPDARSVVRQTAGGPVQGFATDQAQVFLGIPFAAPPTGARRFAPPQPAHAWVGVRPAVRVGPHCGGEPEDCLSLNIYAPPDAGPGHPYPVMVWIYGGAFVLGSNDQYDFSTIAERQGMVVVAPNYRLGALGFLAHPALAGEGDGEGNYGLLDQVAALRWVRANIRAFGGDPARVTAMGESAGAFGLCALMTAPGARGLFDRVILQSGACVGRDSTVSRAEAEAAGLKVAARLGCGYPRSAASCLRALPADTFGWLDSERLGLSLKNGWSPMHGGDVLPQSPDAAFAAGHAAPMPVLQGTDADEGSLFAYLFTVIGKLFTDAQANRLLDQSLHEQTALIRREYGATAFQSRWQAARDVVTDARFACPALRLDRLLASAGAAPVWAYEFDDPRAPFALPRFFQPRLGAFHSSEIAFVLARPWVLSGRLHFTPAQQRLSDRMQGYWGNFVRAGDPNGPGVPPWPRFAPGDEPVLLTVNETVDRARVPFAERHRCAFWDGLGY